MSTELIAITGGIGSGKSIASRVLTAMGYEVYDCDSRAKEIMDRDRNIHRRIAEEVEPKCISDCGINRAILSATVFADAERLAAINAIVHGAVKEDIALWLAGLDKKTAFVETAILYESGLDRMVDCVWEVSAPTELRIERVMRRSALTEEAVIARIKAQESTIADTPHPHIIKLINDGVSPLLPQIEKALEKTWQ